MLRANKLLEQYGLRKAIFSRLLDEVLDIIEAYGGVAIGVMLSDPVKLREIIPALKHVEEITTKKGKKNG